MIIYEAWLSGDFSIFFEKKEDAEKYIAAQEGTFFGPACYDLKERDAYPSYEAYLESEEY